MAKKCSVVLLTWQTGSSFRAKRQLTPCAPPIESRTTFGSKTCSGGDAVPLRTRSRWRGGRRKYGPRDTTVWVISRPSQQLADARLWPPIAHASPRATYRLVRGLSGREGSRAELVYPPTPGGPALAEHIDAGEPEVEPGIAAAVQLGLATVRPQTASLRRETKLNVHAFGMNLHAATAVDGRDRKRLERLSRYLLRPPFATDAVQRLPDGRVRLDIERRGRSVVMSAEQFMAKLIALVPPPGVAMVRYAGVFANAHHLRGAVAPAQARRPGQAEPEQTRLPR